LDQVLSENMKIYGLYGLNHHTVEISGDVTKAGQRQTTEDRATQ